MDSTLPLEILLYIALISLETFHSMLALPPIARLTRSPTRKYILEQFTDTKINPNGTIKRKINGRLHCEYGPAIETPSGCKMWYRVGLLHREDGPAVTGSAIAERWFRWGSQHREDGPAIICTNGDVFWMQGDKYHRDSNPDGTSLPAVELETGLKLWYRCGKIHRDDGPAMITPRGNKRWYLQGKLIRVEKVNIARLQDI